MNLVKIIIEIMELPKNSEYLIFLFLISVMTFLFHFFIFVIKFIFAGNSL